MFITLNSLTNNKPILLRLKSLSTQYAIAILAGILCGIYSNSNIIHLANGLSDIFVNLLKLVSMPIVFLSLVSTISGMSNLKELKYNGRHILKYTLTTTLVASFVGLALVLIINPAKNSTLSNLNNELISNKISYAEHIHNLIPTNIFQPFIEGNVIGVLILAIFISVASLSIENNKREYLHNFFTSIFAVIMKITQSIVKLMPIAVFAFVILFVDDLRQDKLEFSNIALYLICIVLANVIQATIILPLFLKSKKLPIIKTLKAFLPALNVAFWSKSSSAALPVAISCAEDNLNLDKNVSRFSLPLCISINMNACAAFILITVIFVSQCNSIQFNIYELVIWCIIATFAAIGNAGVPMGCFFLASALLAYQDIPLSILGIILPFYALLDMLESAINVWSDACVTVMVNKDIKEEAVLGKANNIAAST